MTLLAKIVLALTAVILIGLMFLLHECSVSRHAGERAAVSESQAAAATASGVDAVSVVGNRASTDAQTDAVTRSNDAEIRNAAGADQAVAAPLRDAGLASLCRRAAYRGDPKCLQYARP